MPARAQRSASWPGARPRASRATRPVGWPWSCKSAGVGPRVRRDGRQYFSFIDVVQVKAAKELTEHGVPLQRVRRSIELLRGALPGVDRPLALLRVCGDGERVVVVADEVAFEPYSGQV